MSGRILITGGAGFIGANAVHWILKNENFEKVIVLDCFTYAGNMQNLGPVLKDKRLVIEHVDIRDLDEVSRVVDERRIGGVLHLAAESHVDRSISNPATFIETNVLGTFNLLEACRKIWAGNWAGKRFVHVSTDEVFGSLGEEGKFSEHSNYSPNSPYSASKAGADHIVRAYHKTYGFPAVITNCSNNFGPYQHPEKLIPLTINRAVSLGEIPIYGNGKNVRDWLYVEDHVRAMILAYKNGELGESYNIGGENEWSNIAIVKTICDMVDKKMGRQLGSARKLITFVADRAGHDFRYAIDSNKARQKLGWASCNGFEVDLGRTIDWYLSNKEWIKTAE